MATVSEELCYYTYIKRPDCSLKRWCLISSSIQETGSLRAKRTHRVCVPQGTGRFVLHRSQNLRETALCLSRLFALQRVG